MKPAPSSPPSSSGTLKAQYDDAVAKDQNHRAGTYRALLATITESEASLTPAPTITCIMPMTASFVAARARGLPLLPDVQRSRLRRRPRPAVLCEQVRVGIHSCDHT